MLSKLALVGTVAATQLYTNENPMLEMLDLFNEVKVEQKQLQSVQNLLKISLTEDQIGDLQEQAEDIKKEAMKYEVDKKTTFKFKMAAHKLQGTQAVDELLMYIQENMPVEETVDGYEYHPDLQPLVDQMNITKEAWRRLDWTCENTTDETGKVTIECDNARWEIVDVEMGKLAKARKEFINSAWGQGFMERINAVRGTEEYQDVMGKIYDQAQTEQHQNLLEMVGDFVDSFDKYVDISDDPESFLEGNTMKTLKVYMDMAFTVANGEPDDVFDWIETQLEWDGEE